MHQLCEHIVYSVSKCRMSVSSKFGWMLAKCIYLPTSWNHSSCCPLRFNRCQAAAARPSVPQHLVQLCARAEPEPCTELLPIVSVPAAPLQLRNFRCGEVEFVSQVGPRPSLLCLKVEEVGQDALHYLNSQRMSRTSSSC